MEVRAKTQGRNLEALTEAKSHGRKQLTSLLPMTGSACFFLYSPGTPAQEWCRPLWAGPLTSIIN